MSPWITIEEACSQLGVRPQTVYAYVSRGKLEVSPDPEDSRRSLYRADAIASLAKRKQDGRKRQTLANNTLFGGEPSIPTALTSFVRGRPHYRGQDALALAQKATLEQVAQLLWAAEQPVNFASGVPKASYEPSRASAFASLATLAAGGHSTRGRVRRVLQEEAQTLVGQLAHAFGIHGVGRPMHERFAMSWNQAAEVADLLRVALVLLADHELTSSAFAARIAASTGASLPACLLAGLATFSGPLHGDASRRVKALFDEVARRGVDQLVDHHLSAGLPIPGFGHHLYPDGDPRAARLLALFAPPRAIGRLIDKVVSLTGMQPNIDVALAALVARYGLPGDAAFALFATARSVGLLAHSMEQLGGEQVIRPRGRYVGVMPQAASQASAP